MKLLSAYTSNNGVRIHYLDSHSFADDQFPPIIICPGLSETAEEYADLIEYLLPRRSIALSFRGRGQSDTPTEGYDLEEHTSDIESVLRATNIQAFHLFTYSRGVSYALRFAQKQPSSILSLILGDYPPEHRKMSAEWAEDYIQHYLEPHHRLGHIRPEAVRAIQRESTQIALHEMMRFPVLVTKGMLEDSLISETDLQSYNEICTNLSIKCFQLSGHGIKMTEKELFYESIQDFLKRN